MPLKSDYNAFFTVPVTDLVDKPMPTTEYTALPLCATAAYRITGCPRVHQARYNEMVTIIEQTPTWALIELPHIFFTTQNSSTKNNRMWTPKSSLTTFEQLHKKGLDLTKIPQPLDFNKPLLHDGTTVSLMMPFHDPSTQLTFSLGTRFVMAHHQNNQHAYNVWVFDTSTFTFKVIAIPKNLCVINTQKVLAERIKIFVHILHSWAHLQSGYIPYVWGGCTLTNPAKQEAFTTITTTKNGLDTAYFAINGYSCTPKNGLDCSGAIATAAHIAGLPYYFKNTATLNNSAPGLLPSETLSAGDFIVIKGHVLIVANIAKNLVFEARGYDHGYGKFHEIELGKVFNGITTFKELTNAYFTQQPLIRLDKDGNTKDTFSTFKLIKLVHCLERT